MSRDEDENLVTEEQEQTSQGGETEVELLRAALKRQQEREKYFDNSFDIEVNKPPVRSKPRGDEKSDSHIVVRLNPGYNASFAAEIAVTKASHCDDFHGHGHIVIADRDAFALYMEDVSREEWSIVELTARSVTPELIIGALGPVPIVIEATPQAPGGMADEAEARAEAIIRQEAEGPTPSEEDIGEHGPDLNGGVTAPGPGDVAPPPPTPEPAPAKTEAPYGRDFVMTGVLYALAHNPFIRENRDLERRVARFMLALSAHEGSYNHHVATTYGAINPWAMVWYKALPADAVYGDHDTDTRARRKADFAKAGGVNQAAEKCLARLFETGAVSALGRAEDDKLSNVWGAISALKAANWFAASVEEYGTDVVALYRQGEHYVAERIT
jgi:hypothetical protein